MKWLNLLRAFTLKIAAIWRYDWWVKITTTEPTFTDYFGPFDRSKEDKAAHLGYVEDLLSEGAQDISVSIKRCRQPEVLTLCDETEL